MATYTPNLNLKKPTGNEYYDVVAEDNDAKDKLDYIIGSHTSQLVENKKKIQGRISIHNWENEVIDLGLPTEDWKNAFKSAADYLKTQAEKPDLIFSSGTYRYSVSPNWAMADVRILSEGKVILKYSGIEDAVIIDAGDGAFINFTMGKFVVYAPPTSKNGVRVKGIHHSDINIIVQGCGTEYDAFHLTFCVLTEFHIKSSLNDIIPNGFYLNAKPKNGLTLHERYAGEKVSYCIFYNPIFEGCGNGGYLDGALGNSFIGGTFEQNDLIGITLTEKANNNKFYGTDFELNGTVDIYCKGYTNFFYSVDADKQVTFDSPAHNNVLNGGGINKIDFLTGTAGNTVENVRYNFMGDNKTISDGGLNNRLINNFNVGNNTHENRPRTTYTTIPTAGNQLNYTNTSGNDELIFIKDGTISAITFWNNGAVAFDITNLSNQFIKLCPTDAVIIDYTIAPTVYKFIS